MFSLANHTNPGNHKFTFKPSKYLGFCVERMQGSDSKWYLSFTVWYPQSSKRLGYLYFATRSI